jgi:hypothetical protein
MANECRIIDNKMGGDHQSSAENPMIHALSCQWPFGESKLDLKQSSLRRVRSNNLKLASWRAELVPLSVRISPGPVTGSANFFSWRFQHKSKTPHLIASSLHRAHLQYLLRKHFRPKKMCSKTYAALTTPTTTLSKHLNLDDFDPKYTELTALRASPPARQQPRTSANNNTRTAK